MNRNIERNILLRIEKIKCGQSIFIDDLNKEFPDIKSDEFITTISRFATLYFIKIDGKYSYESHNLEKYSKIVGLDREGIEAIDYIKNEKLWFKIDNYFKDNGYDNFSIFNAILYIKEYVKKEFEKFTK